MSIKRCNHVRTVNIQKDNFHLFSLIWLNDVAFEKYVFE